MLTVAKSADCAGATGATDTIPAHGGYAPGDTNATTTLCGVSDEQHHSACYTSCSDITQLLLTTVL